MKNTTKFIGFIGLYLAIFAISHHTYAADTTTIKSAYQSWVSAMENAKGNPSGVVKLYAPNAILLATFSPHPLFNTDNGLDDYFTNLTSNKNLKIKTDFLVSRTFENKGGINSGMYTFSYTDKLGKRKTVNARFTFAYLKYGSKWLIIEHHSSVVPQS